MYQRIYACRTSAEAGMIISFLETNGFNPLELNMSSHMTFAGVDQFYYVQIPEQEYNSAKSCLLEQNFSDVI